MTDVSIIGAGRLGTSLGFVLSEKGFRIKALSCRRLSSAEESQKIIGEGIPSTDNVRTAREGKLVILCLPDAEIEKVAKELALSDVNWSERFVFHCSGLLSSEALKPLKIKGALTLSFHPIQSFSQKKPIPFQFKGIYYGLEGGNEALALSKKIVRKLKGRPLILEAKDKPLYHTACSIASNFFVVLLDTAVSLLEKIGLQEEQAFQILLPLMQGTLQNVKKFYIGRSLTGPVIRGNAKSIKKHLEALQNFPPYHKIYLNLANQALEIAKREKRLSLREIKTLKNLLEEK